ncbi:DUF2529 family protein [Bacillus andreraoultii]|uniref:DUF2529 family protein n=1 Tax=Bacillus andreraoultii TaxID=1499685 RepID=UPI00053B1BB8|nr:DUF2529 family protein [Bacillus andreraoultii]
MSKIFTTQLIGRLKKIEEQELNIEDASRVLAQALVGEGSIYIYGKDEFRSVYVEAKFGQEPLQRVQEWTLNSHKSLSTADRVLMFSRSTNDIDLLAIARQLRKNQVPFVVISSLGKNESNPLEHLADVFINLHIDLGLVPTENGEKKMYPHAIAALYTYHLLKYNIDEMVEDN